MESTDFAQLRSFLSGARRLMLTTHVAPDGDGLGSALALRKGLEAMGIAASIVVPGEVTPGLKFMDVEGVIRGFPGDVDEAFVRSHDMVALLDACHWGRIAHLEPALNPEARRVIIDHHVPSETKADCIYSRVHAAATGEIVYDFLVDHAGLKLDAAMAMPIYVSLVTETGSFRYSNTTARLFEIAGRCIDAGVEPHTVASALFETRSPASLRLLARGLDRLRVDETGKLAWITLSLEDFAETGTAFADIGNMVSYPRSIDGVELSILMFEDEPNFVKMSFRSRRVLDVNVLAREFGGGGHVRAAGVAMRVPLAEAEARVIPRAKEVAKTL